MANTCGDVLLQEDDKYDGLYACFNATTAFVRYINSNLKLDDQIPWKPKEKWAETLDKICPVYLSRFAAEGTQPVDLYKRYIPDLVQPLNKYLESYGLKIQHAGGYKASKSVDDLWFKICRVLDEVGNCRIQTKVLLNTHLGWIVIDSIEKDCLRARSSKSGYVKIYKHEMSMEDDPEIGKWICSNDSGTMFRMDLVDDTFLWDGTSKNMICCQIYFGDKAIQRRKNMGLPIPKFM
jgi:hypothetical protein